MKICVVEMHIEMHVLDKCTLALFIFCYPHKITDPPLIHGHDERGKRFAYFHDS